jgi:predicted transcriptional regulator
MVRDLEVSAQAIMLALHPKWAEAILSGTKSVEVRRQTMHLDSGTSIVLYATTPISRVLGLCRLDAVHRGPAEGLWRRFGTRTGLSRDAYLGYLAGADATCIELSEARRCEPTPLDFYPPQSWMRLDGDRTEHRDLLRRLGGAA